MKSFIVLSILGVALARPSLNPLFTYSHDGRGFSYSFSTPVVQAYSAPFVAVAPSVKYSYAVPIAVKHVEPADIKVSADGFVLDTPEVAQAKAEHLALVAQEASKAEASPEEPIIVADEDSEVIDNAANVVKSDAKFEPANIQVSADGHVLDTPEVAQAKAEHLAQYAAEAARAEAQPDDQPEPAPAPVVANINYQPANIQLSTDGFVLDTPEVAQAKADHFARFAVEAIRPHAISYAVPNVFAYNVVQQQHVVPKSFEIANIQLSADGHVLDTPEVAKAKAEHLAQYAAEAARASFEDNGESSNQLDEGAEVIAAPIAPVVPAVPKIEDPPANIQLSADGFVLDTPEVAKAKAEHLAEKAKVPAESSSDDESDNSNSVSYDAYTPPAFSYAVQPVTYVQTKYVGPEANIKVGPNGFLEDTPEVQQARAEHLATRNAELASASASRYAAGLVQGQFLPDTAEVAAAKSAHLEAHAKEALKTHTLNYGQLVYNAPLVRHVVPTYGYSFAAPYRYLSFRYAPVAAPVALTPDGQYLLDTPEVVAEKIKHFEAHAKARGL